MNTTNLTIKISITDMTITNITVINMTVTNLIVTKGRFKQKYGWSNPSSPKSDPKKYCFEEKKKSKNLIFLNLP